MFLSAVILAIISSYEFFMITVFTISAACSHTSILGSLHFWHCSGHLRETVQAGELPGTSGHPGLHA